MTNTPQEVTVHSGFEIRVSNGTCDPDWDSFLAALPNAKYVQSTLWGQVKALLGWRVIRVVVTFEEHTVAGVQMLVRSLPLLGAVGIVPEGPLFGSNDPILRKLVLNELRRVSSALKIQYLSVQPPGSGENLAREMLQWGFRPGQTLLRPVCNSTLLIDLTQDLDIILAKMKAKTRYNIRLGETKYPGSREGTERDLDSFCRLLKQTGERQRFLSDDREYIHNMWKVFSADGHVKLFLTEFDGEPVSYIMTIAFGDTVVYWRGCWSGRFGNRHPNERLHWRAIQWAKAQGFHYYDFGGIEPVIAEAILYGQPIPEWVKNLRAKVTFYKLGFGGQIVLSSGFYEYVKNPIVRWGISKVLPRLTNWRQVWSAVDFLRRR